MKNKTIAIKLLLLLNALLLAFYIANRIIRASNKFSAGDKFLGLEFHQYLYKIAKYAVYIEFYFWLALILSLIMRGGKLKYVLLLSSILGVILYWNAYDRFTPW